MNFCVVNQYFYININDYRDLGQHLRVQIKLAFAKGEASRIKDKNICEKNYESLDKLASDYYAKKYPTTFKKTSTGLSLELCQLALSIEGQQALQRNKLGFYERVKESAKRILNRNQN